MKSHLGFISGHGSSAAIVEPYRALHSGVPSGNRFRDIRNPTPAALAGDHRTAIHRHAVLAVASVILIGFAFLLPQMQVVVEALGAGSSSLMLWVALPMLAAGTHLLIRANQPAAAKWQVSDLESWNGHFLQPEKLYGWDTTPDQVQNAVPVHAQILRYAELAELATKTGGGTILAAQFPSERCARRAQNEYQSTYEFLPLKGSDEMGWLGRRSSQADYAEIFQVGRQLFVWTAPTLEACEVSRANCIITGEGAPLKRTRHVPLVLGRPLSRLTGELMIPLGGVLFFAAIYVGLFIEVLV